MTHDRSALLDDLVVVAFMAIPFVTALSLILDFVIR